MEIQSVSQGVRALDGLASSADAQAKQSSCESAVIPSTAMHAGDLPKSPASGESGFFGGGEGSPAGEHTAASDPTDQAAVHAAEKDGIPEAESRCLPATALLAALWPSQELTHQISIQQRPANNFKNIPVGNVAEALAMAARYAQAGNDVYFACGEFKTAGNRKAENVAGACGFWLDIDCGEQKAAEGRGYLTKIEGRAALSQFLSAAGLPEPTHIVDSGSGLHVYIVSTAAIAAADWTPAASKLKALAKQLGFLADPSRTSDIASVLRVPGTLNFKYDPTRSVTLTHAGPAVDRDTLIAAIDTAHNRLCGKSTKLLESSGESAVSKPDEAVTRDYGPVNLNKLASALKVLDPDCDEATWKLHRLAPMAREARAHPQIEPEVRKLARDWSSGALQGKASKAWVIPGNSNGLTGEQAFDSQWTRFVKAADNDRAATLGTIYFDAKSAGWENESEDFEVVATESDDTAASSLELAQVTIDALLIKVLDGDFAAPLEPESLAALSVLYAGDQAAYQRARIKLKKANRLVPLAVIDREMKSRVAENGAAPTHHGYAKALIKELTVGGWKPVSCGGELHIVDRETKLWVRKDQGALARSVAEHSDALDNCTRRADYNAVAQHATSLIADETFFADAPVGLACPGGFHRIDDGMVKLEPLTPAHRQRVQLAFTPKEIATPLFDAFMQETFASKAEGEALAQVCLLQEIAGAVMLGLMHKHQKAVLFYDPFGRSGKGTFERILRGLVPSSFVTAVSPFTWHREYFVVALLGARLNVVGELPDNESIPAAMFKSVIGGDLITGRNPTHRPLSFTNEAAHLFMSNHMINSRDQSEAFFSRWLLVEFPNSRLRSGLPLDPGLAERIVAAEMPGIAYWALTGAIRLLNNGAFSKSSVHDRLMARWRRANSSLDEFIHECCVLGPKADSAFNVGRAELYRGYAIWCQECGRKPFAKSRVKELLEHNLGLGIEWAKLDGNEIFRGVRLKTPGDDVSKSGQGTDLTY